MTPQQRRVLNAIQNLVAQKGYSPTFREIADQVGRSVSTISATVWTLYGKGYIEIDEKKPRTIRPVKEVVE